MKKILYLLSTLALLAACEDNSFEKIPNKPNTGGGGTVPEPEKPTVEATPWASLADSCTFVLTSNFLDKSTGTFWGTPRDVAGNSTYLYWQQAHALDVVIYSYNRIKDANPTLAASYEEYFQKWYSNGALNYNKSHKSEGEYGRFFNQWTDDMAWICLTLIHLSEELGDTKYADTAKEVYDRYIWPRASVGSNGLTGLPWTDRTEDLDNKNACTNAPSCLVAAKLYNIYKTPSYLKNAKDLYAYSASCTTDEGKVEEPPLTYTQGTFGEACRVLYHITAEQQYKDMAGKVLNYTFESNRCIDGKTGVLRDEGTSDDQALFKAVFVPYAVNYILDETMPSNVRKNLSAKLELCGKYLSKNLDRSSYPQMYCNHSWVEPIGNWSPTMCAQASGASLFEGLARLEK